MVEGVIRVRNDWRHTTEVLTKHHLVCGKNKRRQIVELSGLQDRTFTYADELIQQRRRLEEVQTELERSTNVRNASGEDQNPDHTEPLIADGRSPPSTVTVAEEQNQGDHHFENSG